MSEGIFLRHPHSVFAGCNGLPPKAVPPTWQSFPLMSQRLAEPRWRTLKGWRKRPLIAGKIISSVKKKVSYVGRFQGRTQGEEARSALWVGIIRQSTAANIQYSEELLLLAVSGA